MLLTFTIPALGHANGFFVEGELERYQHSQSTPSRVLTFEAITSHDKWILRTYESGRRKQVGHVEYGFDGTNQYMLEFVNHDAFEIAAAKPKFVFVNGNVSPRTIPSDSYTMLHVYWLAFRCAPYPHERKDYLPWEFIYRAPERSTSNRMIQAVYVYETTNSNNAAVKEVLLLNPGVQYGMKAHYPLPAPYDKGFVVAQFKVLEQRRVGPLSVPTSFEWQVNSPRSAGMSSNDLDVLYSVRGKVTNLLPVDKDFAAIPAPPNGVSMVVTDYRFQVQSGVPGGYYVSTSGFLRPDQPEYQYQVHRLRASIASDLRSRRFISVIFVLFVILSACALFLLWMGVRKKGIPG